MRTYQAKPHEVEQKWYVVDAANKSVGRLASQVAKILRGKHKPIFTPHVDTGDFVIVVNAAKARLTGNKASELIYWHTMYPGGLRNVSRGKMLAERPERTITRAVKGMLPHNKLGAQIIRKLKVYSGPEHPHEAQQPEKLEL
ncbi:MAG: 50S ribosomal protein L13 [Armatimonadetes bacterium]|nr:50S ribosomal protein L13 [Armatimonadota bacterium]